MDLYTIEKLTNQQGTMMLPDRLYQDSLRQVTFGTLTFPCTFISTHKRNCYLSEDLLKKLGNPYQHNWSLYVKDDTLYFLPIIGIFTTEYKGSQILPFGQRTEQFKHLIKLVKAKGGYAFYFTAERINWERGEIRGLVYEENHWKESTLPFPQLVYDRTPNRRAERLAKVKNIKDRFQLDYGIPWFNPNFFNKWDLYQMLKSHPLSNQYLPETYPLNYSFLTKALNNFTTVYIKPKNSSHGVGIKRITKSATNAFACYSNTLNGTVRKQYTSVEQLMMNEFNKIPTSHYIIQQGIELQTIDGRPFDFRIHTNKDGKGKWQMSAIAVKMAGEHKVTTHHLHGGKIKSLSEVFNAEEAKMYINLLKEDVLALSEALDESIGDLIGELGIDIGIDKDKRVWLFEINARPGRIIFHHPLIRRQEKLVHHYWLEYCCYLAKLTIDKPYTFVEKAKALS